jgi:hypothetical protein
VPACRGARGKRPPVRPPSARRPRARPSETRFRYAFGTSHAQGVSRGPAIPGRGAATVGPRGAGRRERSCRAVWESRTSRSASLAAVSIALPTAGASARPALRCSPAPASRMRESSPNNSLCMLTTRRGMRSSVTSRDAIESRVASSDATSRRRSRRCTRECTVSRPSMCERRLSAVTCPPLAGYARGSGGLCSSRGAGTGPPLSGGSRSGGSAHRTAIDL